MRRHAEKDVGVPQRLSAPRPGIPGIWDRLSGPGATPAENALNLTWTLLFTAGVVLHALVRPLGWSPVQLAVVALFAFDIAGGVSVNASPSARRWWHRPVQGRWAPLRFVLAHLHPFALALLFPAFTWGGAALLYGYAVGAALAIVLTPRPLQRPLAFVLYALSLLLSLYLIRVPAGLEWFAPLYLLKLLLAHTPLDPEVLGSDDGRAA